MDITAAMAIFDNKRKHPIAILLCELLVRLEFPLLRKRIVDKDARYFSLHGILCFPFASFVHFRKPLAFEQIIALLVNHKIIRVYECVALARKTLRRGRLARSGEPAHEIDIFLHSYLGWVGEAHDVVVGNEYHEYCKKRKPGKGECMQERRRYRTPEESFNEDDE